MFDASEPGAGALAPGADSRPVEPGAEAGATTLSGFGALPIGARTPEIPGAGPMDATVASLPSRTRPTAMIRHAKAGIQTPGNESRGRGNASNAAVKRIAPDWNHDAAAIEGAHPPRFDRSDPTLEIGGSPRAFPPDHDLV